ncbi:MAG TPA: hypothetical protein VE344_03715 [Methylomirabilota bacterium]|nr:hypothetical protein [Methylomirabilota bacterium]
MSKLIGEARVLASRKMVAVRKHRLAGTLAAPAIVQTDPLPKFRRGY